jgi:predicted nucleotide-binding protein
LTIQEVLTHLLTECSFAILLLTAESQRRDGRFHARDNVIHELGLFQGRLGFHRVIILIEEGVEEFSNIRGINQVRFKKGKVLSVLVEVAAAIQREFMQ